MDYRGGKRSSISFGSYQRQLNPLESGGNNGMNFYSRQQQIGLSNDKLLNSGMSGNITLDKLQTKTSCQYQSNAPLYGLTWNDENQCALGTYKEDSYNRIEVIQGSPDCSTWDCTYVANVVYPVSRIQWMPQNCTRLGTCSDSLRIWSLDGGLQEQINLSLYKYGKQPKQPSQRDTISLGQLPPVTSFHWNPISPNLILSSSIDTTCTVWDLSNTTNYVKTQLIAHDSEVYDVKFLAQSTQLFASCGGDGSVRVFDLRSLAHSTIVYEHGATTSSSSLKAAPSTSYSQSNHSSTTFENPYSSSTSDLNDSFALLRLEPNPFDPNIIATVAQDSNLAIILDMRYPGSPLLTLEGHIGAINQLQWDTKKSGVLISCGDDCQVLYWDLNNFLGQPITGSFQKTSPNVDHTSDTPQMSYSTENEINNIVWNPAGTHVGAVSGKVFTAINIPT